jgi:hypothetical protein
MIMQAIRERGRQRHPAGEQEHFDFQGRNSDRAYNALIDGSPFTLERERIRTRGIISWSVDSLRGS